MRSIPIRMMLVLWAASGSALQVGGAEDLAPPQQDPWPQWRGPNRDAISPETGLLHTWPEGGPRLLWKADGLGIGFSTPSLTRRAIYVMGNRDEGEWIFALDPRDEGRLVWKYRVGEVRHGGSGYPGPRSTPTCDGDRVYALGINGDLVCLSAARGQLLWQRNLVDDFGGRVPNWGYSESVLIDGPTLICTPGGDEATIVALDKYSGELVWKSAFGDGAGYASVIRAELPPEPQYVQFTARGVVGVAARDGRLLWRYDAPANGTANCSTPLWSGQSVFAASGYGTGGGRVEIAGAGSTASADEAFFTNQMKNHHGGIVVVDGFLYGSNDPGLLTCLDFETGEVQWRDRACGKCSVAFADGMIFARSQEGTVSLVEATPEEFRLRGQFEQPDRSA